MARKASLTTIKTQIARLQKQAEKLERESKPGLGPVLRLMKKYRLTSADVAKALEGAPTEKRKRGAGKAPARVAKAVTKVAPKFRDPVSGSTWTGRGRTPNWMVAEIAQGKKKEDFAI